MRRGDTLYSIAFRNGLDYRELASANGIGPPYTIYPGQEIRLQTQSARSVSSAPAPRRADPPARSTIPPGSPGKVVAVPAAPPGKAVTATQPATPAPVSPPKPSPVEVAGSQGVNFRWPAEGQLVATFVSGDQTRQGVNIAGRAGDPVRAAADGEVVYSGNGLIGYGELIIVKHNATLLSAYGHNRRRLVQEGERVKAGQQIAEMGSSSATRDMLHFEIRRNGKPVDPLGFLPRR